MIGSLSVVALIPARGGSKTVPRKNLRLLGGRPLLAWAIGTALSTPEIDRVFVSTDDAEIAGVARECGAEIHDRPRELAGDASLVIDTVRHLQSTLRATGHPAAIMVLLEATSPFRTARMVSGCIRRLADGQLDSIATFSPASINPERTWRLENGIPRPFIEGAVPWRPRQQLTPAYQLNGAVYAFRGDRLPAEGPSILFGRMGAEVVSSDEVIDIDDERDFVIANAILESGSSR
ncbi:MAG: acylneuraminate cytidylyltransferase family protein [Gammaproteobacteria bacterium]|nr:acylneuraminate cytidylyltransferase family protein [Gammaproteobacteria bacterium]MCG3144596.1 N-acylneuraminate cytidylyltransferase [Gammaproteobacteria bacterium]